MFKTKEVAIDKIIPYEDNARINHTAVDKVAQSIAEYGWQSPIVVDEDMVILAGHTRHKAAQMLGIKKVPVKIAEGLEDKQKMAYRIMDNKSQDYAQWDNKLLAKEFEKLADGVFDLKMTGFSLDEIAKINSSMLEFDAPEDVNADYGIDDSFDVPETNIKQFMLLYTIEELEKMKGMLDKLQESMGYSNYSETVFKIVTDASKN